MHEKHKKKAGLHISSKTVYGIAGILVAILFLAGMLTQVLPRGQFDLDENGSVIAGTYQEMPDYKLPIWKIAASPVLAFTESTALTGLAIIAIIMLVGGTFLILDSIGVLKYMMAVIVNRFEKRRFMLIAVMTFLVCSSAPPPAYWKKA